MFLKKIISICILRKVYVRENSLNKFASAKLMESVSLKDNLQNFPIISFLNWVLSFWLLSVGLEVKLLFSDQSFLGTVC